MPWPLADGLHQRSEIKISFLGNRGGPKPPEESLGMYGNRETQYSSCISKAQDWTGEASPQQTEMAHPKLP